MDVSKEGRWPLTTLLLGTSQALLSTVHLIMPRLCNDKFYPVVPTPASDGTSSFWHRHYSSISQKEIAPLHIVIKTNDSALYLVHCPLLDNC